MLQQLVENRGLLGRCMLEQSEKEGEAETKCFTCRGGESIKKIQKQSSDVVPEKKG